MLLRSKDKFFWIVLLVLFAGIFVWVFSLPKSAGVLANHKTIQIGGGTIRAELALTLEQQKQGLSGRTSLAPNTGMLFDFGNSSKWGIWMKDMNFPIDVLWITDNFKISDIVENMTPASYPQAYLPSVPVRYVLEIPSGGVQKYGIKVGQEVFVK